MVFKLVPHLVHSIGSPILVLETPCNCLATFMPILTLLAKFPFILPLLAFLPLQASDTETSWKCPVRGPNNAGTKSASFVTELHFSSCTEQLAEAQWCIPSEPRPSFQEPQHFPQKPAAASEGKSFSLPTAQTRDCSSASSSFPPTSALSSGPGAYRRFPAISWRGQKTTKRKNPDSKSSNQRKAGVPGK